jgi:Heterokaryon incompatibility protein (HET)
MRSRLCGRSVSAIYGRFPLYHPGRCRGLEYKSSTMASIYEHAYVTITATGASNSSGGLSSVNPQTHHAHSFHYLSNSRKLCDIYARHQLSHCWDWPRDSESQVSDEWPLINRAWAYQERLLPSRVLHFTTSELWWGCGQPSKWACSLEIHSKAGLF